MFILCIVQDDEREGQRRAAGRTIRHRVAIGVDRFNVSVCDSTAELFVGRKFSPRFEWIGRILKEDFGLDPEHVRQTLRDALKHIFECELPDDVTLTQLDAQFRPGKCAPDSSGELELYRRLKVKYGTSRGKSKSEDDDDDDDKSAIILYDPTKQGE